jgi:hypothetical protein
MKFRNVAFASTAAVIAAVAIGTGAAQATSLIGSHDIKDDSIRSIDVRDGGIHRHDLGLGLQGKINKHATNGVDGVDGKDGVDGTNGVDGVDGTNGVDGVDGKDAHLNTYIVHKDLVIPAGTNNKGDSGRVSCNAGDIATGGGFSTNDHNANFGVIYQNRPDWNVSQTAPDAWMVQGYGGNVDSNVDVWVICSAA